MKTNNEATAVETASEAPKAKVKRVISAEHRAKLVANAKKAGEVRAAKIAARKAEATPAAA